MLLGLNVGNTNVAFGVFDGMTLTASGRVPHADLPLLAERIGERRFRRILAGSVAPSLNDRISAQMASAYGSPVAFAGIDVPLGIETEYTPPASLGVDRALGAIAAFARVKSAVIVADAGTAITVNLVTHRGTFAGGTITAGPTIMARALHADTELLPQVELGGAPPMPPRNTADAIRAGIYWGTVGMVEEIVRRLREVAGSGTPLLVTGGAGEMLAREMKERPPYHPHLVLEGLAILGSR